MRKRGRGRNKRIKTFNIKLLLILKIRYFELHRICISERNWFTQENIDQSKPKNSRRMLVSEQAIYGFSWPSQPFPFLRRTTRSDSITWTLLPFVIRPFQPITLHFFMSRRTLREKGRSGKHLEKHIEFCKM